MSVKYTIYSHSETPVSLELNERGFELGIDGCMFMDMDKATFKKFKTAIEMIDEYWDNEVKEDAIYNFRGKMTDESARDD